MSFKIISLFNFLYFFALFNVNDCVLTEAQCFDQIYKQCNHPQETTFTPKEIQTTQLYLRRRFGATLPIRLSCPISPDKPPCIRKEIKCLTQQEITALTAAWLKLYQNGVIAKFTKLHSDYWGAEHKFTDGPRWHFWFINQLEKELQKIDPTVCMPYWNFGHDFANPEKSKIWDIFGHSGDASNDYCVPDGPFANITCAFPSPHCLRRQWRISPQLDPWKGPEYYTMAQQMLYNADILDPIRALIDNQATLEMQLTIIYQLKYYFILTDQSLTPYSQRTLLTALIAHFDTHLAIGGFAGDMSVPLAPCDPIFHPFHIYGEMVELLWQLSNDKYLVPKSWNSGIHYNNITGTRRYQDIDTDRFNYYYDIFAFESFQFGYGDMCHLYDIIIKPINELVNRNLQLEAKYPFISLSSLLYPCVPTIPAPIPALPSAATLPLIIRPLCDSPTLPTAAQRLKNCMDPSKFALYYPKFASNKWSFMDNLLPNVSPDCNPVSSSCKKMPYALPFSATAEGQRQYAAFDDSVADFDVTGIVDVGQAFYEQFMNDTACVCSPYV